MRDYKQHLLLVKGWIYILYKIPYLNIGIFIFVYKLIFKQFRLSMLAKYVYEVIIIYVLIVNLQLLLFKFLTNFKWN